MRLLLGSLVWGTESPDEEGRGAYGSPGRLSPETTGSVAPGLAAPPVARRGRAAQWARLTGRAPGRPGSRVGARAAGGPDAPCPGARLLARRGSVPSAAGASLVADSTRGCLQSRWLRGGRTTLSRRGRARVTRRVPSPSSPPLPPSSPRPSRLAPPPPLSRSFWNPRRPGSRCPSADGGGRSRGGARARPRRPSAQARTPQLPVGGGRTAVDAARRPAPPAAARRGAPGAARSDLGSSPPCFP